MLFKLTTFIVLQWVKKTHHNERTFIILYLDDCLDAVFVRLECVINT